MVRVPRWLRDTLAVIAIALVATALILAPPLDRFHGVSIDVLTWLRWRFYERSHPAPESRTVVVALDEETYRTPPFAGTPAITWTRQIGQVLTAVLDGGATVVGFDIVFPTSIEQSEIPFGDGSLGARLRGFDRDFLRALALGARDGKVVLGEAQHRDFPIMPSPGQRIAVGQGANIRSLTSTTIPTTSCGGFRCTSSSITNRYPRWRSSSRRARLAPLPTRCRAPGFQARSPTRWRSISAVAPMRFRPTRWPIFTAAPRTTIANSSTSTSMARSCSSARCSMSRIARSPRSGLPRRRKTRIARAACCRDRRRARLLPATRRRVSTPMRQRSTISSAAMRSSRLGGSAAPRLPLPSLRSRRSPL